MVNRCSLFPAKRSDLVANFESIKYLMKNDARSWFGYAERWCFQNDTFRGLLMLHAIKGKGKLTWLMS